MGQGYSLNTLPAGPSAIETTELSDLTFEKPLGGGRFLRTVRARHQHGIVVVKVCAKNSPTVSFKEYAKELRAERSALRDVPNVLPYQKIRETATIGVLVRQFIHSSLYDRMSIRPFLEGIEKKWIAFQLLCAVRDCHTRGRYHGDIKSENVLVTSWGWVYLTDFASVFKPVYLPEGNPADFTFYYDISARRTCYVAPERFLAAGQQPLFEGGVEWSMDIFSLGCVIAELFTEVPTFTLSQLFAYRKGEYDPTVTLLSKVEDDHIRSLITSMIRLSPEERWHAQDYLDEFKGKAFPLHFYQHLHTLMQEITDPSSGRKPVIAGDANNAESDNRIDRIYNDFEMLSVSLGYEASTLAPAATRVPGAGHGLFPLQVDLPNNRHTANPSLVMQSDNGTFILLNVVATSLRSVARASSKIRACELLLAFAERIPDEAKLDRVLPYVMPLLVDEPDEMVLVAALRTITQLLALVTVTSPVNSSLFTQYIFPRLQSFVRSSNFKQNPIVRATYAACLASLAETASRFLDMMQALRVEGSLPAIGRSAEDDIDGAAANHDSYDATRAEVLDQLEAQTKVFLTDNNTAVRRAFLSSVSGLCVFFGESRASDVVLSHLNTYLNDPDWQLKCAFFRTIVGVAVYVGGVSLEEFILPLMLQALSDPQEFVVEQALRSLASMAEMGLLQRAKTWELIDTVARFEMHPNMWIKEAATHFVSAATTYLSLADIRILVAPLIKPYLKIPASTLTETELLDALKKPLPRAVLDLALQWAGKVDKSVFWKQAREARQLANRPSTQMPLKSSVEDMGPKALAKIPKTDEDEQWLGRLRNAGMRNEDEMKILAFREHLWRAAQLSKHEDNNEGTMYDHIVPLAQLKVELQTVIFETSVDIYNERRQAEQQADRRIEDALQEAATVSSPDASTGGFDRPVGENRGLNIPRGNGSKRGLPQLPDLRRQTSGSGQSLSSSPGSGIGLLGKGKDRASQSKSNAARLLSGADLRNKALPAVATDDATAAGKLNAPSPAGSRSSRVPSSRGTEGASGRAGHNYSGNDPTVLRLLDAVYVDTFPMDVADFGPVVQALPSGPIPSNSSQASTTSWRPTGQLVAVLGEHSASVTRVIVAPDHTFFVTGSDDGFIKIWDTSRMERNVTHRSRYSQPLGQGVKVTSLCFIETTHSFVCTGSDGSVHFFKILVVHGENGPQYAGKMQLLRTWQIPQATSGSEHAVWSEHFRAETGSMLILATNVGRVLAVDLRHMSVQFEFSNPAQHGTPTCFCLGRRRDWILIGTTHGVLDLWDLRFRLRLRSWAFPRAAPITRLQLHPSKKTARRNRVCVTGGTARGEVTVWDIEKAICHEILRPDHVHSKGRLNARDYELRNLDDDRSEGLLDRVAGSTTAESSSADAIVSPTTSSFFGVYQPSEDSETQHPFAITGGPDNRVRFWDCDRLDGCRLVSGHGIGDEKPTYTFGNLGLDTRVIIEKMSASAETTANTVESSRIASSGTPSKRGTGGSTAKTSQPSRYEAIRLSTQHLLDGHLDRITDVALVERPFGMVVSADRSGQVFVYQ